MPGVGGTGWQLPVPGFSWIRKCQGELGVPVKVLRAAQLPWDVPAGTALSEGNRQERRRETGRKEAEKLGGNKQEKGSK